MEAMFQAQTKLCNERGLDKVRAVPNDNYRRHGTKSYVSALSRYGFQPTKPGPYFQKFRRASCVSGKAAPGYLSALWTGLFKQTGDDRLAKVTAEDQQNDVEYLCEVSIGSPPQKVLLDFNTGSADLWVKPHAFSPEESSTFKLLKDKSWRIQYGDGSYASGIVGTDLVSIGGLVIKKQAVEIANQLSPQFSMGSMHGLLGLAFRQINTVRSKGAPDPQPTPVDNMISQRDIPTEAELFTCALYSARDQGKESFYTFGWIDQDLVKESGEEISWTNIDSSQGFWMFSSERVTINGEKVTSPGNKAIADTGTTLALLSDDVCDALYKQIKGASYSAKYQGFIIPKSIKLDELPKFSIAVGDKEFVIHKEDLLFAMADSKHWYGGVQSRGENPFDILGGTFLKSIYAIWDQGHKRFGAVPKIGTPSSSNSHRDT
ncbi:hypothetical protein VTK56DRAFT_1050 [Thermocarpiscus australiensis]